jgi:hypothetical protein
MRYSRVLLGLGLVLVLVTLVHGQSKPRARDLGIPFDGTPGRYNAFDLPPSIVPALERIFRPENNGENRWGQLIRAFLTLVRHVSMRPTMTALRAGRAGVDVDPLYERMYTSWRKREG